METPNSHQPGRTGDDATGAGAPLAIYPTLVPDVLTVGSDAAEVLTALGRTPSPFAGMEGWPSLAEILGAHSTDLLARLGEDGWERAGGEYDALGRPTFHERAAAMEGIFRELAGRAGGFRYTEDGVEWAVRLSPVGPPRPGFIGFAVGWQRGAAGLVLGGERAERVLWAVQAAAAEQSDALVVLPDVALAQTIWGGHPRPKDWRAEGFALLRSLMYVHAAVIRFGTGRLVPRFTQQSVALAHLEDWEAREGRQTGCPPGCPMAGCRRHGHFLIQVGAGFERAFGAFAARPERPAAVRVHLPTKLFAAARWSALTRDHRRVIDGLFAEVTRVERGRPVDRPDRAEVASGNRVPDFWGRAVIVCPHLSSGGRYVAFGGNGGRRGLGYRIIGRSNGGWLGRCGYVVPPAGSDPTPLVRQFLDDLAEVSAVLGLVVVGLGAHPHRWWTLDEMRGVLVRRRGFRPLDPVHLRVYGPEDYLDRIRRHFERAGGFERIPARPADLEPLTEAARQDAALVDRLRGLGQTQAVLADALAISQPMVSKLFSGRPFSADLRLRIHELFARCEPRVRRA